MLTHESRKGFILRFLLTAVVIFSFFFYLNPYREHFIKGFYFPVQVPGDYNRLNDRFALEGGEGKALYLPTSESMIQSYNGVATPFWNNNTGGFEKPTGDFHIYNSLKDTVFHHEGSIPEISYYLKYLQYLMDGGLSSNIISHSSVFSTDEFIYHKEYKGQEARQDFNLSVLDAQTEVLKKVEMGIFTSYYPEKYPPRLRSVPKTIFTPYGLSHLESIQKTEDFSWSDSGVIFSAQNKNSFFSLLRGGDMYEAVSIEDIMLSSIDEKYYLDPFDFINDGNPFLKWAKTRLNTADWMWYLKSQGIDHNDFDFEPGSGMAVTFSSSRLDLPPHKMKSAKGDLLVDFNSLLRIEKFFTPDNPHLFSAQANPISPYNDLPVLHGVIQKGDANDVWQVAKSGLLAVTGDTPYQFRISLSGRGTNKMHVKVRFFDEDLNELGITYVIAPSEEISFNGMTLFGEYISPSASKYMRIDLLSYQRPEQKVYWWIHDIEITDLKQYKAPNKIYMNSYSDKSEKVHLYIRAFRSAKGGRITLSVNDNEPYLIETEAVESRLRWFDLGIVDLNKGENRIEIENREGFNAVNTIVLIPVDELKQIMFPFRRVSDRGLQFITAEAESGFEYTGNIQTQRRYPSFSSGHGIRSTSGLLEKEFEILQNGHYNFTIYSGRPDYTEGYIHMVIEDLQGNEVYSRLFPSEEMDGPPLTGREVVFDPLKYKNFPRRINKENYSVDHYTSLSTGRIPLPEGNYILRITIESGVPSM
ncbi:MAG: hypothetical protein GY786_02375, partial [Proteobacteria bacterium]|nr:hypothetical protein [Pseudomonadota bacterium]